MSHTCEKDIRQKSAVSKVLAHAKMQCAKSGSRFTPKRSDILKVLLKSSLPLSAYEISDIYNEQSASAMPVMSVYRILDFLQDEHLVHKLSSANKYVACSHIACEHSHQVSQFLICSSCEKVEEISVSKKLIENLTQQVEQAGFHLIDRQLELKCLCSDCR